jgi:hypothetical protein
VDAAARGSHTRPQSGYGACLEVLVRNRLLLIGAIMAAAIGTATGAASSPAAATAAPCGTATAPHAYQHVMWIWMENRSYSDIIGNKAQAPYINSLAADCGVATDYHNTTHPSLPNYLAATSGLSQPDLPVLSYLDCNVSVVCDSTAASIFGQGETWKSYEESMPSNCLPAILNSKEYRAGTTAVFITWDEGSGGYPIEDCDDISATDSSCHVPTIVISPSTPVGAKSRAFFNHYSVLATTEQLLGLPKLRSAASATTMTTAFRL